MLKVHKPKHSTCYGNRGQSKGLQAEGCPPLPGDGQEAEGSHPVLGLQHWP